MAEFLICADCGDPTPRRHPLQTRCKTCHQKKPEQRQRRRRVNRAKYGSRWQRVSRRVRNEVGHCESCNAVESLTTDHIVPLSAGGTNDRDNLRVLCLQCHERVTKAFEDTGQILYA